MHLWFRRDDARWRQVAIDAGLRVGRDAGGRMIAGGDVVEPLGTVVRFAEHGRARAALIVKGGARLAVNGFPALPARVLSDRDEIAAPSDPEAAVVFTACAPAHVRPFVAGAHPERCGRCRQELGTGDASVRCPACGVVYHEGRLAVPRAGTGAAAGGEPAGGGSGARGETRACWSYDARCGVCRRERAEMAWTPAAGGRDEVGDEAGADVGEAMAAEGAEAAEEGEGSGSDAR
jgi:hypothetical protein